MSSQIKGLSQFIADIRATQSHDAERSRVQSEMVRIRQKLSSNSSKLKGGYELKKNVAKLLYIYILGYPVDVGARESLALITSSKYSEKQIGYLSLELILSDNESIVNDALDSIFEDLRSPKELHTALALNFVSGLQNPPHEMVDAVFKLLVSPTSAPSVARKAALTLTAFYRQDPKILSQEWCDRIVALLDSSQIGVETSITDLIVTIARQEPSKIFDSYNKAIRRLHTLWTGDNIPLDYVYYNVSAPWLTVKLLQLLKTMNPAPEASTTEGQALRLVVHNIVCGYATEIEEEGAIIPQHANARNSILYEAICLASSLAIDIRTPMKTSLLQMLKSKDINTRYFSLQVLEAYPGLVNDEVIDLVLALVKDRDISLRRQALDSLYSSCTSNTVEHMAAELLNLLVGSELSIMPQMVARLAGIIEQFATSERWYIDTSLSLLTLGGSFVGDAAWQRLVQIVVNNKSIRPYACEAMYRAIRESPFDANASLSDNIIKAAAFILGEYAPPPTCMDVFVAFQDHIDDASPSARCMLLTAYAKMASRSTGNLELLSAVMGVMQQRSVSADPETHQRACEFAVLLRPNMLPLLKKLCEESPAFSADNTLPVFAKLAPNGVQSQPLGPAQNPMQNGGLGQLQTPPGFTDTLDQSQRSRANSNVAPQALSLNPTGQSIHSHAHATLLTSNWEHGYRRMLTHSEAVLFQDSIFQIGCRYIFNETKGSLTLYIRNVSAYPLTSISAQVNSSIGQDVLSLQTVGSPSPELNPEKTSDFEINCEAHHPFAVSPTLKLTYMAGSLGELNLRLPIVIDRFMTPMSIAASEFVQRWSQLSTLHFEKKFRNWSGSKARREVDDDHQVVKGLNWGIVHDTPPSARVILAAAVLHTSTERVGCLLKLEPDASHQNYTVAVRATNRLVAVILANDLCYTYTI